MTNRREFLKTTAAISTLGSSSGLAAITPKPMNILILGGSGFIGPHMVASAQARGHTITLFNRGRTNPNPDVETLIGNRDGQLAALQGRHWDAVIDNSGYIPRHVRDSASLLRDNVGRYLFVSTISVYADFKTAGMTESYSVAELPREHRGEQVTGATYGPFKVLCEAAVQANFFKRSTIVRPGYIVGPRDGTDRWTYWPLRVAAGGPIMIPGGPTDPVQFIDARDLGNFVLDLLETDTGGTFNAVGPGAPLSMIEMLDALIDGLGSDSSLIWTGDEFFAEQKASVPIWAPAEGETKGLHRISAARAKQAGLGHRSVATIAKDTVAWWQGLSQERQDAMRTGLRLEGQLPPGPASMAQQLEAELRLREKWRTMCELPQSAC